MTAAANQVRFIPTIDTTAIAVIGLLTACLVAPGVVSARQT